MTNNYNPIEDLMTLSNLRMTRPDGCGYFLLNNCKRSVYVSGVSDITEYKSRNLSSLQRGLYIATKQVEKYLDATSYVRYLKFVSEEELDRCHFYNAPGSSFISKEFESAEKAFVDASTKGMLSFKPGTSEAKTLVYLNYSRYEKGEQFFEQRFGVAVKAISLIDNVGMERVEVVKFVGRYKILVASSLLADALASGDLTSVDAPPPTKGKVDTRGIYQELYGGHFKTIVPVVDPLSKLSETERLGNTLGKVIKSIDSVAGYVK